MFRRIVLFNVGIVCFLNAAASQGVAEEEAARKEAIEEAIQRESLYAGVLQGNVEWVSHLLDSGVDVNADLTREGEKALAIAAREGHEAVVDVLLRKGADVSVTDKDGRTALMLAANEGREGVVKLILDHSDTPPTEQEMAEAGLSDKARDIIRRLMRKN